ncbi:serine protease 57 [Lepus europaeus]|uniref:serine protease 57 n=1 Tax=Lepus europaeus TaxID=9983 RepID=UPI002B4727C3|nr:serine protease 57 [Lepus europaeus]
MGPGMVLWGPPLLMVLTLLTRPPSSWGARVVGGREVTPHSRPFMAAVSFEGQQHCGGFLLRAGWVVSAAHCFHGRDPRSGLVVLGAHALHTPEPTQQVLGIAAAFGHPDYRPSTHANDICLLRLNRSAVLGPAVGLLRLPRTGAKPPAAGVRCRVAGWGSISSFEESPPGLMEAEVRVLGLDACNSSWKGQLSPNMLCTRSGDRRRRGFCTGDSGGPLVCRSRAHGLVSFSGLWCGDPKTPDVYTQVSAFVAWIWEVVQQPSPAPRPPGHLGGPAKAMPPQAADAERRLGATQGLGAAAGGAGPCALCSKPGDHARPPRPAVRTRALAPPAAHPR